MQVRMRSLMENKYARLEYERRFLLRETTAGLDEANSARIVDHYIRRTANATSTDGMANSRHRGVQVRAKVSRSVSTKWMCRTDESLPNDVL